MPVAINSIEPDVSMRSRTFGSGGFTSSCAFAIDAEPRIANAVSEADRIREV